METYVKGIVTVLVTNEPILEDRLIFHAAVFAELVSEQGYERREAGEVRPL